MDPNRIPATGQSAPAVMDFFMVLGILALVALLIFFWAVAIRNPGKKRKHKHRRRHRRKSILAGGLFHSPSARTSGRPPADKSKKPPPPALRK